MRSLSRVFLLCCVSLAAEPAQAQFAFDLVVVEDAYPGNTHPGWSGAGDIDGDGLVDVLAGGGDVLQWYRAPGWQRFPMEGAVSPAPGSNGGRVFDVDGDGDLDVVTALYKSSLVWWENPGLGPPAQGFWNRHTIDPALSAFHHDLIRADVDGDGQLDLVSLHVYEVGSPGAIYWYPVPADPAAGPWPRTRIAEVTVDPHVGLAAGDLDGDGDLDVVSSDRWYEQPADPTTPDWTERVVFAAPAQNLAVIDVNGDGRLDVAGAEGFSFPNGLLVWAENPPDPLTQSWTEHVVASDLDGPENLWAGDLDGDGHVDLVTAEMGTSNGFGDDGSTLLVFEGLSADGLSWQRHTVAENVGVSARITPVDVDHDGDVDFTADGNAESHIYLWVNQTVRVPPVPALGPLGGGLLALGLGAVGIHRAGRSG